MASVFLSHASQDTRLTHDVARWLLDASDDVFLDQDVTHGITVGDDWEERLHAQLRRADAVVCLVTAAFVGSTWCAGEVAIARTHGCRLLPVRVEPGAEHPFLTGIQHVDLADGDLAWARLLEGLRRVDAVGGGGWPPDRSPYPGLRPFTADQHQVFFGRSVEINELAGLLRSPVERAGATLLLVVGPSGCGKSSLVRAGLLPLMADEPGWWALSPMLPGTDPVTALARELAAALKAVGTPTTVADVRRRLYGSGLAALADEVLHAAPGPRRHRLLLVVDQFEELLSQSATRDRVRFAELLRPAAGRPVQVVATIRPEFLDQLLRSPELAGLPARTYTVRPLPRDALAAVIERPARLADIAIDDGLVTRLVSDTDGGEALPLLAYTLAELAEGVERGGRLLLSRYEHLGGVRGTLARQADAALDAAAAVGGRNREQIVRGLLALVTVDEHGRPTRRRVPLGELPAAGARTFHRPQAVDQRQRRGRRRRGGGPRSDHVGVDAAGQGGRRQLGGLEGPPGGGAGGRRVVGCGAPTEPALGTWPARGRRRGHGCPARGGAARGGGRHRDLAPTAVAAPGADRRSRGAQPARRAVPAGEPAPRPRATRPEHDRARLAVDPRAGGGRRRPGPAPGRGSPTTDRDLPAADDAGRRDHRPQPRRGIADR